MSGQCQWCHRPLRPAVASCLDAFDDMCLPHEEHLVYEEEEYKREEEEHLWRDRQQRHYEENPHLYE